MVAAAKLRRAQEAAQAARPYAERMGKVLAALGAAYAGQDRCARRCSAAPARTRCICWSWRPASVAWPAASTRRSRAWRASTRHKLFSQGKTVKILTVGRKGNDILKRQYRRQYRRHLHLPRSQQVGFVKAQQVGGQGARHVCRPASSTWRRCSSPSSASVISQVPTAQQLIPAKLDEPRRRRRRSCGRAL